MAITSGGLLLGASWYCWNGLLDPPGLLVPSTSDFVLPPMTVINPGRTRVADTSVSVRDGRIARISAGAAANLATSDLAGFAGQYLLPGLIDLHVHLPPRLALGQQERFALLWLAHGVTGVRDMGGTAQASLEEAREVGKIASPRIFRCGTPIDGAVAQWPTARSVDSEADTRQAVGDAVEEKSHCVKVFAGISPGALDVVASEAHAAGIPVVGHLPFGSPWNETRINEIQHVCDPRCWVLDGSAIDGLVAAARQGGVAHTPTLVVFEGQQRRVASTPSDIESVSTLLPSFWSEVLWHPVRGFGRIPISSDQLAGYAESLDTLIRNIHVAVHDLHAAGVELRAGSDTPNPFVVPGESLHRELALLASVAGMSPEEALEAATIGAADALREPTLGRIEVGAEADLLILREDPTETLSALSTIEAVVVGGRLYRMQDLRVALGRQDVYFGSYLFESASSRAASLVVRLLSAD